MCTQKLMGTELRLHDFIKYKSNKKTKTKKIFRETQEIFKDCWNGMHLQVGCPS